MRILIFTLFVSTIGFANQQKEKKKPYGSDIKYGTELPINQGIMIQIDKYDPESKTYEVFSVAFPGEGNSKVTLRALAKAMNHITVDKLRQKPMSVVGTQYKLDHPLPTLADVEIKKREKIVKRKKRKDSR